MVFRWKTVFSLTPAGIFLYDSFLMNWSRIFIGMGKIIVELCSADIVLRVCKYRSCRAEGLSAMTSAASRNARDAFSSPSAAITLALASLAASASAAMALCR
eukprot:TRINITY_DN26414_c0_g1_i1.p1 TRINITY_DN26414_c0_g1~~TRINITY_DN26414_c0_g1_i1.p1  ORF type:complete len:102 (+),score=13.14 TRINITY_DN26414_c0_g1_i1:219-524(+)